jgi:hypothetical protein
MRERAETTEEPPQQIITQAVRNIDDATSGKLGAVNNIRRAIRRNRQKTGNPIPVPLNAADIDIPRPYQLTDRDAPFLRYDNGRGEENRILIFASDHGINCLRDNEMVLLRLFRISSSSSTPFTESQLIIESSHPCTP